MNSKQENEKSVILFSGGIDSTTALYWARQQFAAVTALVVHYEQRHSIEVETAQTAARRMELDVRLIRLPLKDIVHSALMDEERAIPESLESSKDEAGIPFTYVPFRNGIFLSLAAAFAESRDIRHIVTGFNLIDTPDYPDTTAAFTQKMEAAINQGTSASITNKPFRIHTPLIGKTKQEIIRMGLDLGADYSYSVSCYRGAEIPCLKCPSCDIRSRAFRELNLEDPLITRLKEEGKL
jgi:7-cyano-7-deazaguanine synthase